MNMRWQDDAFEDLGYTRIRNFIAEHCLSDLAREAAGRLTPLDSRDSISRRSRRVSELTDILEYDDPFPLQTVDDCRENLRHAKIENALLQPESLLSIATLLSVSRQVRNYISDRRDQYPELMTLVEPISSHKEIEEAINGKIDHHGSVRDNASGKLRSLRREIQRKESEIREQMTNLTRKYAEAGMLQDNQATIRAGRLAVPVKAEYKNKVKGIVHDQSGSGQTFFIEPMAIVEGNNRLKELQMEEQEEVERILRELTGRIGDVADDLLLTQDQMATLDLLHAMALYSRATESEPPIISTEKHIDLKEARNPVLLKSKKVVPNSVAFGDEDSIVLITGPNAGGKTVSLKTAGLMVLMGMTGMHIPAEEDSVIPMVDAIYVDIGDRQSLENDLSTFSSHIQRISRILDQASAESLVLLDELGTGTDPTEGAALARGILEELLAIGSLAVATTHHGSLKAFAHNTDGILNAAMQFNQEDLSPTYVLQTGRPGSSYALEIAGRVGMQEEVISRARGYLDSSKEALEDLIVRLEKDADRMEKERVEFETQRRKYENLKREYESKVEKINKEVKKAKQTASEEAQKILDESSRKIEQAIREIKESQASKESIKAAKEEVSRQKEKVEDIQEETREEEPPDRPPIDPDTAQQGDLVYVAQFDRLGTIAENPSGHQRVQVDVDGKRMEIPMNFLHVPSQAQREQHGNGTKTEAGQTRVRLSGEGGSSHSIDLRGQRVAEALTNLEQFFNRALVNGMNEIEIIHGKGTGALQSAVDDYLSRQSRVKEYRMGKPEEGGAGVTIAELQ